MNQTLHKLREILAENNYRHIRHEVIIREPGDTKPPCTIEWWSGPKGVVLIQHEDGEDAMMYCDWSLGSTFEDLSRALKLSDPRTTKGN